MHYYQRFKMVRNIVQNILVCLTLFENIILEFNMIHYTCYQISPHKQGFKSKAVVRRKYGIYTAALTTGIYFLFNNLCN